MRCFGQDWQLSSVARANLTTVYLYSFVRSCRCRLIVPRSQPQVVCQRLFNQPPDLRCTGLAMLPDNRPTSFADELATFPSHRPFPAAVMQLENPAVSNVSMDLSEHLPLRLGCRAALWDGSVYLYRGRSECVAIVPLRAGEKPTPELIAQRVGLGTWKLVSDWRPKQ